MIFPLLHQIDENELFIIFSTMITWAFMFLLPKRLSAVIRSFGHLMYFLADGRYYSYCETI